MLNSTRVDNVAVKKEWKCFYATKYQYVGCTRALKGIHGLPPTRIMKLLFVLRGSYTIAGEFRQILVGLEKSTSGSKNSA